MQQQQQSMFYCGRPVIAKRQKTQLYNSLSLSEPQRAKRRAAERKRSASIASTVSSRSLPNNTDRLRSSAQKIILVAFAPTISQLVLRPCFWEEKKTKITKITIFNQLLYTLFERTNNNLPPLLSYNSLSTHCTTLSLSLSLSSYKINFDNKSKFCPGFAR